LKQHDLDGSVLEEQYTFHETTNNIKRKVLDIWGVLRDIGGFLFAISLIGSYFLKPISVLGFKIEAISTLFDVQTEDQALKR